MTSSAPPTDFDFAHAVSVPFRMQPGLRRLADGAAQLHPNRPGARHLREKVAVLQCGPQQALLAQPGFDASPGLAALARHAAIEHPQAFAVGSDGTWQARWLGCAVAPDGALDDTACTWTEASRCLRRLAAPLRRTALLALAFEEDFALVDGAAGTLPWLAVALPSHWAPETKIGRHFAEVHAPVADSEVLRKAGAHLMQLACGPQRWERFVWTLTHHPRLHAHPERLDPSPWPAHLDADALAGQTWWRTERQTFIPVPGLSQAVFTIRVCSRRLTDAGFGPGEARQLHDSLASMSTAVLDYRSLAPARDRLLDWLARQAERSEAA